MMLFSSLALGPIVAFCGVAAAIGGALVGLIFRGAAAAWREEKDAAVAKADRLAEKVDEQAEQLDEQSAQIATLKGKVEALEKRTDYEAYAKRSARDHRQILDSLVELTRSTQANSIAVEFLIKQAFPAAALPTTEPAS